MSTPIILFAMKILPPEFERLPLSDLKMGMSAKFI